MEMLSVRDIAEWLPAPGEEIVCGVSGGLDSMVLLHLLWTWRREHGGTVIAAHYNHHLREHAARDETFVRDFCARMDIPFVSGGGDVKAYASCEGLSIEEAARKLRYAFLRRAAGERRIYVAHHADDNAETILWNLIRGTGLQGLSGMRRERDGVVRPLLDVTRKELEAYAEQYNVPHVEDETNADPGAASRNLLRLEVMPLLRRLNPKAAEHLRETGQRAALLHASMEADARRYLGRVEARDGVAAIPRRDLSNAPENLRPLMVLSLLDRLGAGRKDFGAVHLQAVVQLADGPDGKRVDLPRGVTASLRGGWLLLETRPASLGERTLLPGVPLRWGAYELTLTDISNARDSNHAFDTYDRNGAADSKNVSDARDGAASGASDRNNTDARNGGDASRVRDNGAADSKNVSDARDGGGIAVRTPRERVTVRPCPAGERLYLPGSTGARTLKRLCADRKITLAERDALPAFYIDGRLAAVWRIGVDKAFVPDTATRCYIRVRVRTDGAQKPICGK